MPSEKRLADRERAQGAERDAEIRAETDKEAAIILAEADKTANLTRGEGEAEAITIFAGALEQDPEFYTFQRSLEAYKKFLTQNTTVVLPANSDLFRFLQSPTERMGKQTARRQNNPAPRLPIGTCLPSLISPH